MASVASARHQLHLTTMINVKLKSEKKQENKNKKLRKHNLKRVCATANLELPHQHYYRHARVFIVYGYFALAMPRIYNHCTLRVPRYKKQKRKKTATTSKKERIRRDTKQAKKICN